jgi:hypothetical protein
MSRISVNTIKSVKCSTNLTKSELERTTFEVLKITNCASIEEILTFITSQKFHDHFHQAKCAFVIVAELKSPTNSRKLTIEELSELSWCYRDKKLMVISIDESLILDLIMIILTGNFNRMRIAM